MPLHVQVEQTNMNPNQDIEALQKEKKLWQTIYTEKKYCNSPKTNLNKPKSFAQCPVSGFVGNWISSTGPKASKIWT